MDPTTRKCQNCGTVNPDHAQICLACGRKLELQGNVQTLVSSEPLRWPSVPFTLPSKNAKVAAIIIALLFWPFWFITIPTGIWLYWNERRLPGILEERKKTIEATGAVLIARANYVGGHPVIVQSQRVLLALTTTTLKIYRTAGNLVLAQLASVELNEITEVGTGKPKTAHEIYDQEKGYTIDVVEKSSFLSVAFKSQTDRTYIATFEQFESPSSAVEWANNILAYQHKLETASP